MFNFTKLLKIICLQAKIFRHFDTYTRKKLKSLIAQEKNLFTRLFRLELTAKNHQILNFLARFESYCGIIRNFGANLKI